jgi:hypothetical protein
LLLITAVTASTMTEARADDQSASYADRFARSKDLSEFIDRRAALPAEGSFFYAYYARWECHDDGDIARRAADKALSDSDQRRVAATQRLLDRCRNIPRAITGIDPQAMDVQEGRRSGDRLFATFTGGNGARWFSPVDQDEVDRAFHVYTTSTDPYMVWVVAQKLSELSSRLAVNGHALNKRESRSLNMAFLLAACRRNVDCGPSHRWLQTLCVQNGECSDASLEARWRRTAQSEPAGWTDWQMVDRFTDQIHEAMRSNDWSGFKLQSRLAAAS